MPTGARRLEEVRELLRRAERGMGRKMVRILLVEAAFEVVGGMVEGWDGTDFERFLRLRGRAVQVEERGAFEFLEGARRGDLLGKRDGERVRGAVVREGRVERRADADAHARCLHGRARLRVGGEGVEEPAAVVVGSHAGLARYEGRGIPPGFVDGTRLHAVERDAAAVGRRQQREVREERWIGFDQREVLAAMQSEVEAVAAGLDPVAAGLHVFAQVIQAGEVVLGTVDGEAFAVGVEDEKVVIGGGGPHERGNGLQLLVDAFGRKGVLEGVSPVGDGRADESARAGATGEGDQGDLPAAGGLLRETGENLADREGLGGGSPGMAR